MRIRMYHTEIGEGILTDEKFEGLDLDDMTDKCIFLHGGNKYAAYMDFPKYNCNVGYFQKAEGYEYTPNQLKWINDYIVMSTVANKRYNGRRFNTNAPRNNVGVWVDSFRRI